MFFGSDEKPGVSRCWPHNKTSLLSCSVIYWRLSDCKAGLLPPVPVLYQVASPLPTIRQLLSRHFGTPHFLTMNRQTKNNSKMWFSRKKIQVNSKQTKHLWPYDTFCFHLIAFFNHNFTDYWDQFNVTSGFWLLKSPPPQFMWLTESNWFYHKRLLQYQGFFEDWKACILMDNYRIEKAEWLLEDHLFADFIIQNI